MCGSVIQERGLHAGHFDVFLVPIRNPQFNMRLKRLQLKSLQEKESALRKRVRRASLSEEKRSIPLFSQSLER